MDRSSSIEDPGSKSVWGLVDLDKRSKGNIEKRQQVLSVLIGFRGHRIVKATLRTHFNSTLLGEGWYLRDHDDWIVQELDMKSCRSSPLGTKRRVISDLGGYFTLVEIIRDNKNITSASV